MSDNAYRHLTVIKPDNRLRLAFLGLWCRIVGHEDRGVSYSVTAGDLTPVAGWCVRCRREKWRLQPLSAPLSPEQPPLVPEQPNSHPTDDEATEGAERSET